MNEQSDTPRSNGTEHDSVSSLSDSVRRMTRSARARRLRRSPMISTRLWVRRMVFWGGAVAVSLTAIAFAKLADRAQDVFSVVIAHGAWIILILAPAGLVVSFLLARHVFPGSQGSGIPQVIASLDLADVRQVDRILSLRIAVGKILLTLLGLASGASIGREGPTVQVGASVMHALGRLLHLPTPELRRSVVLAGGAAGIAAAFNTPLAGIVFAIEELSHSYEARTSGNTLAAVVISGVVTIALVGNYSYFGHIDATMKFGPSEVMAMVICALLGGLLGGSFSALLIRAAKGFPGALGRLVKQYPVLFAALCGLIVAITGLLSHGETYGTGYEQARDMVTGIPGDTEGLKFALLKLVASAASYLSGIPGGIFAPSLAIGAGLGEWVAWLVPGLAAGSVVLLGMVAYFSGVVQAPITAAVIVMEMADNQSMLIPLMATSMMAFAVSRLVCRRALYGALARRFAMTIPVPSPVRETVQEEGK
ncbi:H/Cl exchange transporter clcA [Granulibacter bethesdensis]|uniref:chloride channel protein n=1 Tax=Granulibacter bethesdensis TaxID=364410 RepID=UPI00090C70AD|nr:chloride channel protein [Granulibacter bethesdensis]APH57672.1 H/Cl exchange transporter clcA [Granulibacter bethesdensis]